MFTLVSDPSVISKLAKAVGCEGGKEELFLICIVWLICLKFVFKMKQLTLRQECRVRRTDESEHIGSFIKYVSLCRSHK